ncbi:hypothetical protein [Mycolicibacterium elephantis]|uniref:Uncharacterized protein n=1 Tax=Mycolicibacterium elephantis DSM 44368 TaxID=1335622 RepID=A0A439DU51_9MYCO|nr:hypothetical protein [Mycolicibacterium elephantis]RWA20052.1 hypothetical protein MELE44368_19260 [Mycolicibacterium elephantis DSM 44368]
MFDAVALMDGKAQSPRESMVRLALLDAGFPKPRTQFTVTDGDSTATLAMGYEAPMVTVQFTSTTPEFIERIGWRTISAADSRNPLVVAGLVRFAVIERGYPLWKLRRLNFAAAT